ncbi:MAG: AAA family ATPase [Planctomycetota bacterium]
MDSELLQKLRSPDTFPGTSPTDRVDIIQTHLSVVCLVGQRVYKLRKPIELPFVDFRDPQVREHDCREELRLNRRLCPEVYLEVAPLRRSGDSIHFGGAGETIDHAVVMVRLPEDRMLDRLLAGGTVAIREIQALADRMAAFHRGHDIRPEAGEPGHPEQLAEFLLANFDETDHEAGHLFDPALHRILRQRAERDLKVLLPRLLDRIRSGHCVDGHGDLHARNICLIDPPAIYDCLEFSASLRCGDTATENAFLCMDLRERGHPDLAEAYLRRYIARSGDEAQRDLLPPLIQYRAMVRSKVAAIASRDAGLGLEDQRRQASEAQAYLHLCATVAVEDDGPLHLLACGLPASGKSFVFEHLAARTRWLHLSTDSIRKEVFQVPEGVPAPAEAYTRDGLRRIYLEMIRRAAEHTRRTGGSVLLDATFQRQEERDFAIQSARELGAEPRILHVEIEEQEARRRLAARDASSLSDAREDVYEQMKASFERPANDGTVLRLDGATPIDQVLDWVFVQLLERRSPGRPRPVTAAGPKRQQ